MMNKWVWLLLIGLVVTGCSDLKLQQEMEAEAKAGELYSAIMAGDYNSAMKMYDEGYFVRAAPERWREQMMGMRATLGEIKDYTLMKKQMDTRYSGRFFIYEYQVEYEKGKSWEILTLFISIDDENAVHIQGHKIDAPGMPVFP